MRDSGVLRDQKLIEKARNRQFRSDEPPSRKLAKPTYPADHPMNRDGVLESCQAWENCTYAGLIRRYASGFPIGGGPYAVISITAHDQTSKHDWRDFQQIKNDLLGPEWEAVELYPAESRLVDPSNRFYLWCAPDGVFTFGLPGIGRMVLGPDDPKCIMFQRAFP